jgi:hypothetical protein
MAPRIVPFAPPPEPVAPPPRIEPSLPYREAAAIGSASPRVFGEEGPSDPLQFPMEPAERWIEEPSGEEAAVDSPDRGPALWRKRPTRRVRLPDRYDDFRIDGRNPLDIPTFLRKQMD